MVHFQTVFLLKMTILSLHETQPQNGQFSNNVLIENDHSEPPRGAGSKIVHFQTMFLLKMTILSLHEAQPQNGQFSNNVLIENDHSEPPRGATSEWSIFKQCSY